MGRAKALAHPGPFAALVLGAALVALLTSSVEPVRRFAFLDFYDYFYAARAVLDGVSPYDTSWADQAAAADGAPNIVGSDFIYPAWFSLAITPLASLPPAAAAAVWYLFSALLLLHALGSRLDDQPRWQLALLLWPPALFSLFVGQVNILLATLLMAAFFDREKAALRAGISLGVACAIKLSPLLLCATFFLSGRRRVALLALGTCAALVLVGELVLPGSTKVFVTQVLPDVAALDVRHAHPVNQSLSALFLRCFSATPHTLPLLERPAWVAPLTALSSVSLVSLSCVAGLRAGKANELALWAMSIAVMLLVSPLSWESTYVLLTGPLCGFVREPRLRPTVVAVIALTIVERCLDPLANTPEQLPAWLRVGVWPSFSIAAALVVVATSLHTLRGSLASPRASD